MSNAAVCFRVHKLKYGIKIKVFRLNQRGAQYLTHGTTTLPTWHVNILACNDVNNSNTIDAFVRHETPANTSRHRPEAIVFTQQRNPVTGQETAAATLSYQMSVRLSPQSNSVEAAHLPSVHAYDVEQGKMPPPRSETASYAGLKPNAANDESAATCNITNKTEIQLIHATEI